jgi:hypothetical protein
LHWWAQLIIFHAKAKLPSEKYPVGLIEITFKKCDYAEPVYLWLTRVLLQHHIYYRPPTKGGEAFKVQ